MTKKIMATVGEEIKTINNVSKLITRLKGGGTCKWVPESDLTLITKTIIQDGTYIAAKEPEKPYGYSQVTVSGIGNEIMGELGEKSITENGVYLASNDKNGPFYGYSIVVVNVPNAVDDDDDGGGSGGGSGGGDDGGGSGGGDTPGGDTPGGDTPGGDTPGGDTPGGDTPGDGDNPGITGIDEDGDDVYVTTDDDGNIITEKLPSRISISSYPDNLFFTDGQTIDFTGLEVKAYLRSGPVYCVVPDNELDKSPTVASYSDAENGTASASKDGLNFLVFRCDVYATGNYVEGYHYASPIGVYADETAYGGGRTLYNYLKTSIPANVFYTKYSHEDGTTRLYGTTDANNSGASTFASYDPSGIPGMGTNAAFVNGSKAYIVGGGNTINADLEKRFNQILNSIPFSTEYPNGQDITGIEIEYSGQQKVTLQWARPRDGKVLETHYYVRVISSGDDESSGNPETTT